MPLEERKALARLPYEVINSKDLMRLSDHPGYWETRQIFPLLFQAFPDLTATIEQQMVAKEEEEWVTTRATIRGHHQGEFLGVAPTGKAIEIMHIAIARIAEGKVVEHFGVSDWLRAFITFEIVASPTA